MPLPDTSRADIVEGASVCWEKRESAGNANQDAVSLGVLDLLFVRSLGHVETSDGV
jgi:hypothetical protein